MVFILNALVAFGVVYANRPAEKTTNDLIAEFYKIENAAHVSPHSIRKKIQEKKTDFILVDLRSAQEYENEHAVGAINIPAYSDPNTSAYGDIEKRL